jgi:type I restriction enzyme S subunit
MFTNEAIAALRFRQPEEVDAAYMYHALRALDFSGVGERAVKGITLNLQSLAALKVPLPPLAEQRRIAAVLDRADGIRRKRGESLRLLDDLLRSAFVDMFGDPGRNEKAWDRPRLGDIAAITTGNTPPRSHPEYYGNAIEWIKSDNLNTPYHYATNATEGLSDRGRELARTVGPGAILVTCIAGSRDAIGNVALTDREVAFNQQINSIAPEPGIDHRFLYAQLLVGKPLIQRASTNSMKGMVSKSRFAAIRIMNPPGDLQERFGEWFARWHVLHSHQIQAAEESRTLFDSLAQRAFRGEL